MASAVGILKPGPCIKMENNPMVARRGGRGRDATIVARPRLNRFQFQPIWEMSEWRSVDDRKSGVDGIGL